MVLETHIGMVLETHMKLCIAKLNFLDNFFLPPKLGKETKSRVFLNLLKDLVLNFYWICSIMKIDIIYCLPSRIPYLGRILFLRYGPKCSQPISRTFKSIIFSKQKDEAAWRFACWYKFMIIKNWLKIFGMRRAKVGMNSLVVLL